MSDTPKYIAHVSYVGQQTRHGLDVWVATPTITINTPDGQSIERLETVAASNQEDAIEMAHAAADKWIHAQGQ